MEDETTRSINAFLKRRIYSDFDRETLAQIPDDKLEQAILDHVIQRIGKPFDRELEVVTALSPGVRAIYTTLIVENEVDNGGFNHYFWNSEGRLAQLAIAGFHRIGASAYAEVMQRAVLMYSREKPVLETFKEEGTLEAYSESCEYTEFGDLDREFFALSDIRRLGDLRIAYIRSHPDEFVTTRSHEQK